MGMIVTLTPNPAIDLSSSVERVVPARKLRCTELRRDPGGGGVNVARVIHRFGGDVEAILPIGGPTGQLLRRLIDQEGLSSRLVEVQGDTREDFSITERDTRSQYRFVMPGARLLEWEWQARLAVLSALSPRPKFVVGSGSLPPGVPDDFYARAAAVAGSLGAQFVLDTSGAALAAAIERGLYMIKPNLHELSDLVGGELATEQDWTAAAHGLIKNGKVEVVALSLGHLGALLVTSDATLRAAPLPIQPISAVGAGDSFLGAMVFGLANGSSLPDAFRLAVAAGSAALTHEGTEPCRPADTFTLAAQVFIAPV